MKKILVLLLYIPFLIKAQYSLEDINFWIYKPASENVGSGKDFKSVETTIYAFVGENDSSYIGYKKDEYNAGGELVKQFYSYNPSDRYATSFKRPVYEGGKLKRIEQIQEGKITGAKSFDYKDNRISILTDSTHKENILKTFFSYRGDTVTLHVYSSLQTRRLFDKFVYVLDSSLRVVEKIDYYSVDTNYITDHEYYKFKNAVDYDYYKYTGEERILEDCTILTHNKDKNTLNFKSCKPSEEEITYYFVMNKKNDWITQTYTIANKKYRAHRLITYY